MLRIYHHIWPGENGVGLDIGKTQKERLFNNIKDEFTYHPNIAKYTENECPTILKMLEEIREFDGEDCILYIHTKGASKPNELYEKEWREYLELSLIDDYKSHIEVLNNGFDTSGVLLNYKNSGLDFMKYWGGSFYPGNFWWSKVKTFNKLTVNLKKQWGFEFNNRYSAESKLFTFVHNWNPCTLYPSFENFKILYEYIVKENQINKESFETRLKKFL